MSPDRIFISFTPTPIHLSNNLSFSLSTWLMHYPLSISALFAFLSNTCLSPRASCYRWLSFFLRSLHLSLFTAVLSPSWSKWLIPVCQGRMTDYSRGQRWLFIISTSLIFSQLSSTSVRFFFPLQSCAFFQTFWNQAFFHLSHLQSSFICYIVFLWYWTNLNTWKSSMQGRGISITNSSNSFIHLHSFFKYFGISLCAFLKVLLTIYELRPTLKTKHVSKRTAVGTKFLSTANLSFHPTLQFSSAHKSGECYQN